ncbi:MAG: Uma2 family endonuclease [Acidobacteria bacterium]|nr:Uma2 family endonuclease [Acidobacteriota bacterium]
MTYDLYCLLPDDGKQYEVIDGELFITPAPKPRHQKIVLRLAKELSDFVMKNSLGEVFVAPVDVILDQYTVLEPDVLFIRQHRLEIVKEEAIEGAPDLVVEVLSPSTFYKDLRKKMTAYSQFGVQEYWIADSETQTIEIYTRRDDKLQLAQKFSSGETVASALLPGLRLAVKDVF